MTSPSLKNHPTTAPLKATRFSGRSLWKQLLAGALCLCVTGGLSAEEEKPLDRLKQRSARQRWREIKGEWIPAPDAPGIRGRREPLPPLVPDFPPMLLSAPRGPVTPVEPQATPQVIDGGESPTSTSEWQTAPVPEPSDAIPEVARDAFTRPSAKPPANLDEPLHHEGSVVDAAPVTPETLPLSAGEELPAARAMPADLDLPNFPFRDETPLVETLPSGTVRPQIPAPAEPVRVAELPGEGPPAKLFPADEPQAKTDPLFTPAIDEGPFADSVIRRPVPPADEDLIAKPKAPAQNSTPIRVAQQPADPAPENPVPAYNPPAETTGTAKKQAGLRPVKSIREIQPFSDYATSEEVTTATPASRQAPKEIELASQGQLARNNASTAVFWQASNVTHNPLYFEDVGLERSGHTFSEYVQPFVSLGHFGVQVVALPYTMALDPAWKDESTLGYHRPGECQPPRHLALPLNVEAAATAAAAYTGIIFLLP